MALKNLVNKNQCILYLECHVNLDLEGFEELVKMVNQQE